MQPPNSTSPRMTSSTPGPAGYTSGYRPTDRNLPSQDVTADNITDAFVEFILYCNPNFPLDVDTAMLRSTFESPPKSDNKDFETFRLYELIKKFDAKEIKTWGQLALDLGVEAPDVSKGQSVQKVQQYSVRLKRWMRAMHVDAFFEFLLGKQHSYFVDIPHPSDPYPSTGRDGVTAEEDLAIRALDPAFRPKRGRRRNSEAELEDNAGSESGDRASKQLESTFIQQHPGGNMSELSMSAHPDGYNDPWAVASAVTPQSFAPWSGRPSGHPSAIGASNLRWQLGHAHTPNSPHPMTAMSTSMSAHIDAAFDGEPKSAVTPSSRKRRRHGPAVSSAWPSANAPGSKPRGRPPASRNTQDGPFSTFPADPSNGKNKDQQPTSTPAETQPVLEQPSPQLPQSMFQIHGEGRPSRLSLQVPQRAGGPVRLATPPMLLVNGETGESGTTSNANERGGELSEPPLLTQIAAQQYAPAPARATPGFSFETLKRVVTSDLLRADISGRRQRLTGDEAKRLADSVLDRLGVPREETGSPQDHIARLTAASWLGVGDQVNVPLGPATGHGKKINVTRFRVGADGYEEIIYDEDTQGVREVFDIFWHVSLGGCMGNFEMKGLSLSSASSVEGSAESTHDMMLRKSLEAMHNLKKTGWIENSIQDIARSVTRTEQDDNIDWKARCKALEFGTMVAKGEVLRMKRGMVERIMDAVL